MEELRYTMATAKIKRPTTEEISEAATYRRVKDVLIKVQVRYGYDEIRKKHDLEADYGLNGNARSAMTPLLNERFSDIGVTVTAPEVRACGTVEDLFNLMMDKVDALYP